MGLNFRFLKFWKNGKLIPKTIISGNVIMSNPKHPDYGKIPPKPVIPNYVQLKTGVEKKVGDLIYSDEINKGYDFKLEETPTQKLLWPNIKPPVNMNPIITSKPAGEFLKEYGYGFVDIPTCPKCNAEIKTDDIFCWNCGREMGEVYRDTQLDGNIGINHNKVKYNELTEKWEMRPPIKKSDEWDSNQGKWGRKVNGNHKYIKSKEKNPVDIDSPGISPARSEVGNKIQNEVNNALCICGHIFNDHGQSLHTKTGIPCYKCRCNGFKEYGWAKPTQNLTELIKL